ncbi:hypothetical protein SISSUDRAFT_1058165 [Sistotremastrum suecicum HHB10207 ss-3]|uniref:Uncharacterized protein n=1 Tax=Sistotremastrum suecicum HHB10207 ss-3 TaxID=1314776 RepID=A0A166HS93_9AGAM|nr:hypothetical protein SISSUDRAFT_1058165 [Sistotremastrum suecicum HHB10207 ss-3]
MSIPIEELVASLSTTMKSSHIGQEAIELANLQNQLATTLFCATNQGFSSGPDLQPPNTPTQTSPGWTNYLPDPHAPMQRSSSMSGRQKPRRRSSASLLQRPDEDVFMMEEDEKAEVEDILYGRNNNSFHSSSPTYHPHHEIPHHMPDYYSSYLSSYDVGMSAASSTPFASGDPFLASLRPQLQTHSHATNMIAPQKAFLPQLTQSHIQSMNT